MAMAGLDQQGGGAAGQHGPGRLVGTLAAPLPQKARRLRRACDMCSSRKIKVRFSLLSRVLLVACAAGLSMELSL